MNFLFISPNYPPTYYKFCQELKAAGFRVFGIGDAPQEAIAPELKNALSEYIPLADLCDYRTVSGAVRGLTDACGPLAGVESNNEFWLSLDASLRRDFNIDGLTPEKLTFYQYKSKMKGLFAAGSVPVVPFTVTKVFSEAAAFAAQYGYPVFAKPDKGVGAGNAQKISCEAALAQFFSEPKTEDYIFEIYIEGNLYSYDGLTDRRGQIVFEAAHAFKTPVDRLKETGEECIYSTLSRIPEKLAAAGRRAVKAFSLSGRFFHIEFFELNKPIPGVGDTGDFVGLEVNMRPAGGCTTEMINAAKGIDLYRLWAECVKSDSVEPVKTREDLYCVNVGRHLKYNYRYSPDELRRRYGGQMVFAGLTEPNENPFGNYELIAAFGSTAECEEFCSAATEKI